MSAVTVNPLEGSGEGIDSGIVGPSANGAVDDSITSKSTTATPNASRGKQRIVLVVVFICVAIVAALVTGLVVFFFAQNLIRNAAEDRGSSIIDGSRAQVLLILDRMPANVKRLKNEAVQIIGDDASVRILPQDNATSRRVNETFFNLRSNWFGEEGQPFGAGLIFLYPSLGDVEIPDHLLGSECNEVCIDRSNPVWNSEFTGYIAMSTWYDTRPTVTASGEVDKAFIYSWTEDPTKDSLTIASMSVNRSAYEEPRIKQSIVSVPQLWFIGNGTVASGYWTAATTWGSVEYPNDPPYYFHRYAEMANIRGNTVMFHSYDTMQNWQPALTSGISTGTDDEFIFVIDNDNRVLGFSEDPRGDRRFQKCKFNVDFSLAENENFFDCSQTDANGYLHWFVREITTDHSDLTEVGVVGAKWDKVNGKSMLIMGRPLVQRQHLRVQIIYGVSASKATGNFVQQSVVTIVICTLLVVVSATMIGALAIAMMKQMQRSSDMSHAFAKRIAEYDIDGADSVLKEFGDDSDLTRNFKKISKNLALYRPYLPQSVLQSTASNAAAGSSRPSVLLHDLHSFRPLTCTVAVVKLHAVELGSHPNATIGAVLPAVLDTMSSRGGIVDHVLGDEVRVSFGAHVAVLHHETAAVVAAWDASEAVLAASSVPPTFAIATGATQVGVCGSNAIRTRCMVGGVVESAKEIAARQRSIRNSTIVTTQRTLKRVDSTTLIGVPLCALVHVSDDQTVGSSVSEWQPSGSSTTSERIALYEMCHVNDTRITKSEANLDAVKALAGSLQAVVDGDATLAEQKLADVNLEDPFLAVIQASILADAKMLGESMRPRDEHSGRIVLPLRVAQSTGSEHMKRDGSATSATQASSTAASDPVDLLLKAGSSQGGMHEVDGGMITMFMPDPSAPEELTDAEVPYEFVDLENRMWRRHTTIVGKGTSGSVYRVLDTKSGRFGALKVVNTSNLEMSDKRKVIEELRLLQKLHHENIAAYVSLGVSPSHLLIVQELLGGTLEATVHDMGPLPASVCLALADQLASALAHIHGRGILHLDVKPANVLQSLDGSIKLCDFGSSIDMMKSMGSLTSIFMDGEGQVGMSRPRGTPKYLAPEVFKKDGDARATSASDVWSFGVTLLHLFSGGYPWVGHQFGSGGILTVLAKDDFLPNYDAVSKVRRQLVKRMYNKGCVATDDEALEQRVLEVARACIQRDPEARPSMSQVRNLIGGA